MDLPYSSRTLGDPQERLLRGIPAFARLPEKARQDLASQLAEQSYPIHGRVLDEGEPADRLFLIEEGEVEVSIRTPEGRAPVSRLSEGEMFGEVGLLLPSRRRTARVTALGPLLTSTLRGVHLSAVLNQYPEAKEILLEASDHALVRSFIKCTRPFERLTPDRLRHFDERLKRMEFAAGAVVFKQGDPGDVCYLVRSGVLEVIRQEASGPRSVARLTAGEIVGEAALLTSTPRDASVTVVENACLLALHRADLIEALDRDRRVADHIVNLLRTRERPIAKPRIVLQPRPTPTGETIWVLADPRGSGPTINFQAWDSSSGTGSTETTTLRRWPFTIVTSGVRWLPKISPGSWRNWSKPASSPRRPSTPKSLSSPVRLCRGGRSGGGGY